MAWLLVLLVWVLAATTGLAQCAPAWVPGAMSPGVSSGASPSAGWLSTVTALTQWDPDGDGPAQPVVIVAGYFFAVGGQPANNIAAYDPVTGSWSPLGLGVRGPLYGVNALATMPNGDLVVGGDFGSAGSVSASRVARWNGSTWSALGSGVNDRVNALAVMPNGDLMVGGSFTAAGGAPANGVARWDGSTWSALGLGVNDRVNALAVLLTGELVVGGNFTAAGGIGASRIARWLNGTWSTMGAGMPAEVNALQRMPNGDLIAGCNSSGPGNPSYVMRWDGFVWSPVGPPVTHLGYQCNVSALAVLPNGQLVVGGYFTSAGGVSASCVAKLEPTATWSALGAGTDVAVHALTALPNGDLFAGGDFTAAGGVDVVRVGRWNSAAGSNATWSAIGLGMNGAIRAATALPGGELLTGGSFTTAGGVSAKRVARWNGSTWSPLGLGMNNTVRAVARMPNGDIVAGGEFTAAGSVSASRIARWNGIDWAALGTGMNGDVHALVAMPNGDLVAGGYFTTAGGVSAPNIARWDGSAWSGLGTGMGHEVNALVVLPNGDLVAGGSFPTAGGVVANGVARWNGTTWSALGAGMNNSVAGLTVLPNGDVVAVGYFSHVGNLLVNKIARWNGSAWSALGAGLNMTFPSAVVSLPNGDIVAGGGVVGGGVLQRWNGSAWSYPTTGFDGYVLALLTTPTGELAVGGNFKQANGAIAPYFGRVVPTCPATAVPTGSGCTGAGAGSNTLTAATLPWVNSTFRAVATGLAPAALVLTVTSVTAFPQGLVPLSLAFSQSPPGCDLLVNPDILGVLVTTTGTAQSELFLANVPPLVGVTFYHQMIPIELDMAGAWVSVTATNALQLTAGSF